MAVTQEDLDMLRQELLAQIRREQTAEIGRVRAEIEGGAGISAFDSTPAFVGVGFALKAGSNVTLTKSGGYIVIASSGGGGGSALTVQEEDASPKDTAVTIIRVPNGGLTDNGVGDVSLGYELAGAVSTHAGLTDPHTGYVLESVLTTRGDLIRRGAAAPERMAVGSDNQIVHFDGTDAKFGHGYLIVPIAEWYMPGTLSADTSNPQGKVIPLPTWAKAADLYLVKANLQTAAAGANVELDIKTASTRAGAQTSLFAGGSPDYITIEAGDLSTDDSGSDDGTFTTSTLNGGYLFLYVRQVGSTTGSEGRDLTVTLWAKVYVEFA